MREFIEKLRIHYNTLSDDNVGERLLPKDMGKQVAGLSGAAADLERQRAKVVHRFNFIRATGSPIDGLFGCHNDDGAQRFVQSYTDFFKGISDFISSEQPLSDLDRARSEQEWLKDTVIPSLSLMGDHIAKIPAGTEMVSIGTGFFINTMEDRNIYTARSVLGSHRQKLAFSGADFGHEMWKRDNAICEAEERSSAPVREANI